MGVREEPSCYGLVLTPAGHLVLAAADVPDAPALPEALTNSLLRAFAESSAAGLVRLAALDHEAELPAVFLYWRRLAEHYLTALCHIPESSENLQDPLPPPRAELAEMAAAAPPMRGGNTCVLKHWSSCGRPWMNTPAARSPTARAVSRNGCTGAARCGAGWAGFAFTWRRTSAIRNTHSHFLRPMRRNCSMAGVYSTSRWARPWRNTPGRE